MSDPIAPLFLAFSIPGGVFWPYCAGIGTVVIGLAAAIQTRRARSNTMATLVALGPLFLAIGMAIFGADHFTSAKFVAMIVPTWIPWHLFWAYFVGVALIAAALSLATGVESHLASALLGVMIFIFFLTIQVPNFIHHPHDPTRFTILIRDLLLSSAALAFAASPPARDGTETQPLYKRLVRSVCRFTFAIPIGIYGIDQLLNPTFAPGIPQESAAMFQTMPNWMPAHALAGYCSAAIFIACAIAMLTRKYARLGSQTLGITVLVVIALVYIPITVAKASDIVNGLNYLAIHFALAGVAFMFSTAFSSESANASELAAIRNSFEVPAQATES